VALQRLLFWRPPCLLRTVLVNLKTDPDVLRGVLWASRGSWLVLREPELLRAGQPAARLEGGEVVIHRSNVAYLQVLD